MAMIIQCPNTTCTASFTVAESISGRRVKCKKCGTLFTAQKTIDGQTSDTQKSNPIASGQQIASRALPFEFGRYRMLKKLGQGGMGAVFLAEDTKLARSVAIKLPFFEPEKSSKRVERFLREAQSLAILKHPNICSVFDVGEIEGQPFIVMEFIEGKSLEELIDPDNPMPELQAVKYVRKLANALAHAHSMGIIHRDLKPANVIISRDDEPILLDFGLAMRENLTDPNESRLTQTGAVMGTPCYMAPEQVRGELDKIGPSTDVYALGIMLFELLTGKTPYSGPMGIVMAQILSANVPKASEFRKGIDARLDSLCVSAMSKESVQRPVGMKELEQELLAIEQNTGETLSNVFQFQSAFNTETWRPESEPPADEIPRKTSPVKSEATKDSKLKSKPDLTQEVGGKENNKKSGALFAGYQRLAKVPLAIRIAVPLLILLLSIAAIHTLNRQASGVVVFNVTPADASVEYRIDGVVTDLASQNYQISLPVGEHGLTVEGSLFESIREQFDVKAGKTTGITILLQSKSKILDGSKVEPDLETRKSLGFSTPKNLNTVVESKNKDSGNLTAKQLGIEEIYQKMMSSEPKDLLSALESLRPYSKEVNERLWAIVNDKNSADKNLLRATMALSVLCSDEKQLADLSDKMVRAIADNKLPDLKDWTVDSKFSSKWLQPKLIGFLLEDALVLDRYLSVSKVFARLAKIDANAQHTIEAPFLAQSHFSFTNLDDVKLLRAKSLLAILLVSRDERVWNLLRHSPDPTLRTCLISSFAASGIEANVIVSRLNVESNYSVRRSLIQALAEYSNVKIPLAERESYKKVFLKIYQDDPDAGVHSSVYLLLKKWNMEGDLTRINEEIPSRSFSKDRRWYLNRQGLTMVKVGELESADIVVPEDADRQKPDGYVFSISSTEVTVRQFQKYVNENPKKYANQKFSYDKEASPEIDCPVNNINWYDAVAYCNWLSEKEGIPKDQWCYLPNKESKYAEGMSPNKNFLNLTGYRLPMEFEWVMACSSSASTRFSFGDSVGLLPDYGHIYERDEKFAKVASLRPNDFGIFDMNRNVWEWCQDNYNFKTKLDKSVDLSPVYNSNLKVLHDSGDLGDGFERLDRYPHHRKFTYGFRPARSFKP